MFAKQPQPNKSIRETYEQPPDFDLDKKNLFDRLPVEEIKKRLTKEHRLDLNQNNYGDADYQLWRIWNDAQAFIKQQAKSYQMSELCDLLWQDQRIKEYIKCRQQGETYIFRSIGEEKYIRRGQPIDDFVGRSHRCLGKDYQLVKESSNYLIKFPDPTSTNKNILSTTEKEIELYFRRGGKVMPTSFDGEIFCLEESGDLKQIFYTGKGALNLSQIPVIRLSGTSSRQRKEAMRDFLEKQPDFKGAFYFRPYSKSYGWSDGELYLPSIEVIFGQKPAADNVPFEIRRTEPKWQTDGSYIYKEVQYLNDKPVKVLRENIAADPTPEQMTEFLTRQPDGWVKHRLIDEYHQTVDKLTKLHQFKHQFNPTKLAEDRRCFRTIVKEYLLNKIKDENIRQITDITPEFKIDPAEIAPELIAQQETLGKYHIPGLGTREIIGWDDWQYNYGKENTGVPYIELSINDVLKIEDWPMCDIGLHVTGYTNIGPKSDLRPKDGELNVLLTDTPDKWRQAQEILARIYQSKEISRIKEDQQFLGNELPDKLPDLPVRQFINPVNGQLVESRPILHHLIISRKGRLIDKGWYVYWCHDSNMVKNHQDEANSIYESRRILAACKNGQINKADCLLNFGGHYRAMGRTGNEDYWVITPEGNKRPANRFEYRKTYTSEGNKYWDVVGPEEIALSWSKRESKAPHVFMIDKLPKSGLTAAQKEAIKQLEAQIEADWKDAEGLVSRTPSPPVGKGWGL